MRIEVFNTPGHPCLRPNPERADGLWPGGPFYMVGNQIYFHQRDASAAMERLPLDRKVGDV